MFHHRRKSDQLPRSLSLSARASSLPFSCGVVSEKESSEYQKPILCSLRW
jgi:hypothetical protein